MTLKKQALSWKESTAAFPGVKLLHLLLHTDLQQAHFRFKQLYGDWLKMRSKEWKSVRHGGIVEAVESAPHRQDHVFQLNDSVGNYGVSEGTKVHPQTWLQKKSSVPRLEEFHPVMKEQERLDKREREHEAHKLEVVSASIRFAVRFRIWNVLSHESVCRRHMVYVRILWVCDLSGVYLLMLCPILSTLPDNVYVTPRNRPKRQHWRKQMKPQKQQLGRSGEQRRKPSRRRLPKSGVKSGTRRARPLAPNRVLAPSSPKS